MSVWMVCPSARPAAEVAPILNRWLKMGYRILIQRDSQPSGDTLSQVHLYVRKYQGYAEAMNKLVAKAFALDPVCDWVVCGADDTEPDQNHSPEIIARECSEYFFRLRLDFNKTEEEQPVESVKTFGVMQPTGDRFASGSIDGICGSPWIGREFARRINQGKGPYWPEYQHMFVDEELQSVATQYGVLWQRPDLTHLHLHFMRESRDIKSRAIPATTPAHLVEANSQEHWKKYKGIFDARKRAGFPGSEPLA